jgi:hypothetical protein
VLRSSIAGCSFYDEAMGLDIDTGNFPLRARRQTRHARPDDVDNSSLHLRLASDRRGSPGIESPANARTLGDKEKPRTIAQGLTDANPRANVDRLVKNIPVRNTVRETQ